MRFTKKHWLKQYAFALSLCLFLLWGTLGAGTSLAWFNDTSNELKNVFHVAEFDLDVFHRLENGEWEPVEEDTELFDKNALYEPGYTQIIYLKVKNNGDIPFDWKTAVSVYGYLPGINVFGTSFNLKDYLRFGLTFADTEAELDSLVDSRAELKSISKEPLNNYSSETAELDADGEKYIAVVVRMPEEVTNVANYKPPHKPEVYLGIIISATQKTDR